MNFRNSIPKGASWQRVPTQKKIRSPDDNELRANQAKIPQRREQAINNQEQSAAAPVLETSNSFSLLDLDEDESPPTHTTEREPKPIFEIPKYKLYYTKHPDATVHAGSALLVKENIQHYTSKSYCTDEIQATNIVIETINGPMTVSALNIPPKHNLKSETYTTFFKTLGHKFIAGGDYNVNQTDWGSRITTTKGKELLNTINDLNLKVASTGEPTYWPTAANNKKLELVDFFITKGIPTLSLRCHSS